MTTNVTVFVSDDEQMIGLLSFAISARLDFIVQHDPDDDEPTADDVLALLSGPTSEPEADPTPPHGIERPIFREGSVGGSGARVHGMEDVDCPTCGAAVSETCIVGNGPKRYYSGWGHKARIAAFRDQNARVGQ